MADHIEDALIREVNEDLREEQMQKLWKRYGGYVIGVAVLIVAIVAGYQGWKQYDISTRTDESARFHAAFGQANAGDLDGAMAALAALSADASSGYGVLANFQQAALLVEKGDTDSAAVLYQTIARDNAANVALSGLANVMGAMVEINAGGYNRAEMEMRLLAIAEDTHPYRHSARELLALIALDAGDTTKARELFTQLGEDQTAPQGLRKRARQLSGAN